ncbi:MAG: hypothetical protein JXA42_19285 [Anaerolineales bacterium]|nr:hypothetical protein [Anaerolineales bacterium]
MYRPALVVGLGGTGVLALRHLKAELLSTQERKLPAQIKLVALDTVQEQGTSIEGGTRLAMLRTELEPGEYYWIGGDVYEYVRQVADGEHPHVSSWFQAEVYLRALGRASFDLRRGAGQLRQFGRLAIFKDVSAPARSNIYTLLDRTIGDIRDTGFFTNLDVYLVASVAGGTGAGMFIDIAYLVRQIAKHQHNLGVSMRGFLVLPEAFGAIPGGVKDPMRARALACMRENERFVVDYEARIGYPIHYHATGPEGGIWRSSISERLFDFLYYLDGHRDRNVLTNVLPEFGVTATIADAIAGMLDRPESEAEDRYAQHGANVLTQAATAGITTGPKERIPFDATLGSYTISLPMAHIIEELSYRLAQEAFYTMLVPVEPDRDGFPTRLAPAANAETLNVRGRDGALKFLESDEIQSWRGEEKASGTSFLKEVLKVSTGYGPQNPGLINELASREVRTWLNDYLEPQGETGPIQAMRERVNQELYHQLIDDVKPSRRGEQPAGAFNRILRGVEQYKGYRLGRVDPRTGQRVGGQHQLALAEYERFHIERFNRLLELQSLNILNGGMRPDAAPSQQLGGKLGYLQDFLAGLEQLMGIFLQAMNESAEMRQQQGLRQAAEQSAETARRDLEQKPGGFGAGGRQKRYLNAEQELIEVLRTDIVANTVRSIVQAILAHIQTLRINGDQWAKTLGLGYDSLYSFLLRGRKELTDMIQAENQVRVRERVWDQSYVEELFSEYAQKKIMGVDSLLGSLNWRYDRRQVAGGEEICFQLQVKSSSGGVEILGFQDQKRNLGLLLEPARAVFRDVWRQESVLKYLMRAFPDPNKLAEMLDAKNGVLLNIREGTDVVPANFLHIACSNDPLERAYLDQVEARLVRLRAAGKLSGVIDSADRFNCRLIYTLDLVPLDQIESYRTSLPAYRRFTEVREGDGQARRLGREVLHNFPAEVNAVKYETRLRELKQRAREYHNDVVLQFEDIERFKLFARCWAFDVIRRDQVSGEGGGMLNFYGLFLESEKDELGRVGMDKPAVEIRLSKPQPETADLLGALKTFNYIRESVGDTYEPINYDRVRRALDAAKEKNLDTLTEPQIADPQVEEKQSAESAQHPKPRDSQCEPQFPMEETDRVRLENLADALRKKRACRLYAERYHLIQKREEVQRDAKEDGRLISDVSAAFYLALSDDIRNVEIAINDTLGISAGLA